MFLFQEINGTWSILTWTGARCGNFATKAEAETKLAEIKAGR